MATVGSYEAKTHLPELIERAAKGEKITITRRGVAVAVLAPVNPARATPLRETIGQLKLFRKERKLKGLSIRRMIEEGRR
ncbi:MAG: type II toxin-antitoxin system prevent-host-death family antitoxin [Nitrospinae bacterium]|nr:type II toxin-antitoxin system prevent-host-death family antitoxin [Nitrospinota bacterium]